ncbi:MAG: alpha/beta hydrolase [Rubrivivax sp.]|jgi:arylformamidase|nr:alpha/beta hydrolase [Betaproteobacteria bacterium]MBK7275037.1 alpha/beta hydrolase [Betaproteobacteria bacterium]MBK8865377.1 alpha/beta hydrolase [Betaproteobacteria bacterium]MBL0296674.1 alpha/beta hydrolase [Betaproteobacteria bacterium]MBP9910935.1 alpha/beta hydrolase [Rubrivivax sp.]
MRPRLDPAWLDTQYNNRARVPDHATVLASWAEASALARARSPAQLDVPYGSGAGETLDVFPATVPGSAAAPVLVFIHGGYWRSLDKAEHSFVAPSFNAAGAMVVVPNYALCPAVSIEHIVLQMAAAVAWTWRRAADFGGDPTRIALAGHSAGGHLATMLLSCRWKELADDPPLQPLAGALSISGLYDLEPLRHAPFLQADLRLTPSSVARLSPAFFPRPKGAKLFTTVGSEESDEFLRQNRLIRDVWGPTAVPVCETVPAANHFSVLRNLADPAGRLHELALRLLGLR